MARRVFIFVLFVTAIFLGAPAVTNWWRTSGQSPTAPQAEQPDGARVQAGRSAPPMSGGLPDLSVVAERAVGSVTNISSTQIVRTSNSPFANDPFFRNFFGDRQDDAFGYRDQRALSLGSGVVVSADGYILTNNHVVGDARAEVSVVLPDKREMRATIIGVDEATDIAVLKVAATNLPTLPWGDSTKLRPAEWVLAIGNPFNLTGTVTLHKVPPPPPRRIEVR